jgi:hypothetical protein
MINIFYFIGDDEKDADRALGDGIYSVDAETAFLTGDERTEKAKIKKFQAQHPNWVVGWAYETGYFVLLAKKPEKYCDADWEGWQGSGFNYGSTNLLDMGSFKGRRLLILAEND